MIAKIQVAEILKDADIQDLINQALEEEVLQDGILTDEDVPQTFDEALDQLEEESGIDFRQVSNVIFFGDISDSSDVGEDFGLIVRGAFDENELVGAIEEEAETTLSSIEYKGHRIYTDEDDEEAETTLSSIEYKGHRIYIDEDDEEANLSVLDDNTLVFASTLDAVRRVIDVREGDAPPVSGRLADAFEDLGDVLFGMALEVPEEALAEADSLMGGDDSPIDLSVFTDIEIVGLLMDKDGDNLEFEARIDFSNADSAGDASDAIGGLLQFVSAFSADEDFNNLLDKIDISAEGTRMTVLFKATIDELENIGESLEGIAD
jgi:hypothetical protein